MSLFPYPRNGRRLKKSEKNSITLLQGQVSGADLSALSKLRNFDFVFRKRRCKRQPQISDPRWRSPCPTCLRRGVISESTNLAPRRRKALHRRRPRCALAFRPAMSCPTEDVALNQDVGYPADETVNRLSQLSVFSTLHHSLHSNSNSFDSFSSLASFDSLLSGRVVALC